MVWERDGADVSLLDGGSAEEPACIKRGWGAGGGSGGIVGIDAGRGGGGLLRGTDVWDGCGIVSDRGFGRDCDDHGGVAGYGHEQAVTGGPDCAGVPCDGDFDDGGFSAASAAAAVADFLGEVMANRFLIQPLR